MITTRLVSSSGEHFQGSQELIEQWQQDDKATIWIDLQQEPKDDENTLLSQFGCHPLAIQDAHRRRHPPKIEPFSDHTFILFRGISQLDDNLNIDHLQLALFVGERFIITRHYSKSYSVDYWLQHDDVFQHLEHPISLAIQILHYSSGRYLEQLLSFESKLSDLEDLMQEAANDDILKELIVYKTRLRKLRRVFDYHQRMLKDWTFKCHPEYQEEVKHQSQDLYERCERLHSLCSMYYEICGDLIEGYLSITSHQLNLTMRVLTVITAVFVPLGFIAGLYGMNFQNMPELAHPAAYFVVLGVMATTAITLLTIFYRKNWI